MSTTAKPTTTKANNKKKNADTVVVQPVVTTSAVVTEPVVAPKKKSAAAKSVAPPPAVSTVSVPEGEQKADPQKEGGAAAIVLDEFENSALLASLTQDYLQDLQTLTQLTSALRLKYKQLEKVRARVFKASCKKHRKRPKDPSVEGVTRSPSGFVKPTPISNELALFLGKPAGSEMARTDVTKEINGYIRLHKLQDAENGRIIRADSKLAALLQIGEKEELTYFNLQRYMRHHFAKKDKATGEMVFTL